MNAYSVTITLALLGGGLVAANPSSPAVPGPEKEPTYASDQPLYGKIAFDLEGTTTVWAVLDTTPSGGKVYEVLYFDRDADGDLTEEGERFELKNGEFTIGAFTDPKSGAEHRELSLSLDPKDLDVMLRMKWKGGELVRGGYAPNPGPYLRFASDPSKAPTIQPIAEGPFQVQPWMLGPLEIGGATDVKFFLGHAGKGENAFCAVSQDFLPTGDGLKATLIYPTDSGEERRSTHKLLDRC